MQERKNTDWKAAQAPIKKISSPQMKTPVHIKLVNGLVKKNGKKDARRVADDTVKMIEKLDDANDQAGTT